MATGTALVDAGFHPATGGSGVTLRSVATSLEIPVAGAARAEGDLDFRGMLGLDGTDEVPVVHQALTGGVPVSVAVDRRC